MLNKQVCVVGAGYWGKNHIRTLHELGVLGGIVETNSDLLERFSKKYPNASTYQKLGDALNNNDFAGFTVATPAETHSEVAKKIISSGKHILVEKPISLTIRDAGNLVLKLTKALIINDQYMIYSIKTY